MQFSEKEPYFKVTFCMRPASSELCRMQEEDSSGGFIYWYLQDSMREVCVCHLCSQHKLRIPFSWTLLEFQMYLKCWLPVDILIPKYHCQILLAWLQIVSCITTPFTWVPEASCVPDSSNPLILHWYRIGVRAAWGKLMIEIHRNSFPPAEILEPDHDCCGVWICLLLMSCFAGGVKRQSQDASWCARMW